MRKLLSILSMAGVVWTGCASGNDAPIHIQRVTVAQTDPTKVACDATLIGITRASAPPISVPAAALVTFWPQSDVQEAAIGFEDNDSSGAGHNDFEVQQVSYKYESSGISLPDETRAVYFLIPADADPKTTCFQEYVLGDGALKTLSGATVTEETLVLAHIVFRGNYLSQSKASGTTNTVDFPFTLLPP